MMHSRLAAILIYSLVSKANGLSQRQNSVELVADGEAVKLECPTDENVRNLHVVKWFKDGKEFCRYYPDLFKSNKPNFTDIKYVKKDKLQIFCEDTNVNLGEVSMINDGLYTCQLFALVTDQPKVILRSVSLLVYPRSGPVITGLKDSYEDGEVVQANCTAAPSNPPPSMVWYINGVSADGWSMFTYPCTITKEGLCVLRLGLRLQAKKGTFPRGRASFVCEAGILALPPKRAFATAKLSGINNRGNIKISDCEGIVWLLFLMKLISYGY